jgi:hypothetical protein
MNRMRWYLCLGMLIFCAHVASGWTCAWTAARARHVCRSRRSSELNMLMVVHQVREWALMYLCLIPTGQP